MEASQFMHGLGTCSMKGTSVDLSGGLQTKRAQLKLFFLHVTLSFTSLFIL